MGRQECCILKNQIGLPYSEKSKRFSYHGLACWDSTNKVFSEIICYLSILINIENVISNLHVHFADAI